MVVWPARIEKTAAAKNKQLITVPIIVRDSEMAPLDVYSHSGHMLPMDQDKVASILFQPRIFERPAPRDQFTGTNLYGQLTPPNTDHQYNAGTLHKHGSQKTAPNYRMADDPSESCATCRFWQPAGDGTGRCQAYQFICKAAYTCDSWAPGKSKTASVLQAARSSFRTEDIQEFGQRLAADPPLRHAFTTTPVLRASLQGLAESYEKTASAMRDERLSHLKPTVVQIRESGKGYILKTANHRCYTPEERKISRFEAQGLLTKTAFDKLLSEGQVTLSISGSTGAFCAGNNSATANIIRSTSAGITGLTNSENDVASGVQFASKRDSAAFQQLMSLFHTYLNNGYIYDTVGGSEAHLMVGAVAIDYDQMTYVGNINSFSYSYAEGTPHRIEWSMEFTVGRMYDHAEEPVVVTPQSTPNPGIAGLSEAELLRSAASTPTRNSLGTGDPSLVNVSGTEQFQPGEGQTPLDVVGGYFTPTGLLG